MGWTIELSCGILLTSCTGSLFYVFWYLAGRGLEQAGLTRARFALLKIVAAGFLLPVAYVFLKGSSAVRELGHGYLFGRTYGLLLASRIFLAVWVLGMGASMLCLLRAAWRLHRKMRSLMPGGTEAYEQFAVVYRSLGGRGRRLRLFKSYCISAPCMCGVLRPKVILPVRRYRKDELQVVFTHEIIHYLQGDMLLKWIALLLRALHFFNPLAWMLCREVQRWSEYACDARACRAIGGARRYFQVIADMALAPVEGALSSPLMESKNELVERMEKMKKMNENRKEGFATRLMGVALAGVVFMVGSVSTCAATVKSADMYEYLYHLTDVGDEEEYVPWVNEDEEYTEDGNAEGIVVRTGEVKRLTRSYVGIEWTVKAGYLMETEAFSCKNGDTISVSMDISPGTVSVKIGIIKPDGKKSYIWGSGNGVSHEFTASSAGSYKVFVENRTGTAVDVEGTYHIY